MNRVRSNSAPLHQYVLDRILQTSDRDLSGRLVVAMLMRIRRLLLRVGDPLIHYNLDGIDLMLPMSHDLPLLRRAFPHYSSSIGRIAAQVAEKYPDLAIIDIGANVGDSAAILRNSVACPILCVEGSEEFTETLRQNVAFLGDVEISESFVGAVTGSIAAVVHSGGGTGRLVRCDEGCKPIKTLTNVLGEHPRFANSKMLKVDTDGLDTRILLTELGFLARARPVTFFEYDPYLLALNGEHGLDALETLEGIGYDAVMVYENNGDFLLSTKLSERGLLADIHWFYSGRRGTRYCDLCIFHSTDRDLSEAIRLSELQFFEELRGVPGRATSHICRVAGRDGAP